MRAEFSGRMSKLAAFGRGVSLRSLSPFTHSSQADRGLAKTEPDPKSVSEPSGVIQAYLISDSKRHTQARIDLLQALGVNATRIDPVIANTGCDGSDEPQKKSAKGILLAHKQAWKMIAASGKRSLVLESDWDVGDKNVTKLRETLARAYARDDMTYTSVGWCRLGAGHNYTDPWRFGCTTAYFLNPGAAVELDDSETCMPSDALFAGLCKGRVGVLEKTGIDLHGRCCWWPGDALPGFEANQRGLFQQNRKKFASMHEVARMQRRRLMLMQMELILDESEKEGLSNLATAGEETRTFEAEQLANAHKVSVPRARAEPHSHADMAALHVTCLCLPVCAAAADGRRLRGADALRKPQEHARGVAGHVRVIMIVVLSGEVTVSADMASGSMGPPMRPHAAALGQVEPSPCRVIALRDIAETSSSSSSSSSSSFKVLGCSV